MKDLEYVEKRIEDFRSKIAKHNNKVSKKDLDVFEKVHKYVNDNKWVRQGVFEPNEIEFLNTHCLLTAKPVVYLVNIAESEAKNV